jgi:hypothetical protein
MIWLLVATIITAASSETIQVSMPTYAHCEAARRAFLADYQAQQVPAAASCIQLAGRILTDQEKSIAAMFQGY